MQDQYKKIRIHVAQGNGEPPQMQFTLGEKVGPRSLGAGAEWRISATAVLPIHAYVYYDGTQLFIRSAQDRNRVMVDGSAVGEDWQAIQVPCSVRMGLAVLSVSAETDDEVDTSDSDETQKIVPLLAANVVRWGAAAAEPSASAKPASAASTSVLPVEMMMEARQTARQASRRSRAAGAPPSRPAPDVERSKLDGTKTVVAPVVSREVLQTEASYQSASKQAPVIPATRQPSADTAQAPAAIAGTPMGLPPSPAAPSRGERSVTAISADDAPRPAVSLDAVASMAPLAPSAALDGAAHGLVASPLSSANVGALSVNTSGTRLLGLKRQWSGASRAKKAALVLLLPATLFLGISLTKGVTRRPPAGAAPAPVKTIIATSGGASSAPSATSAPADVAPSDSGPALAAAAPAKPVVTSMPGPTSAPSPLTSKQKTLQRRAVDAVAAGAHEEAARIYEELAQSNPAEPAYVEAARILKAKRRKP
jgi:hypothetical protein